MSFKHVTLEHKHNSMINKLENDSTLSSINKKLDNLNKKLKQSNITWNTKLNIEDEIEELLKAKSDIINNVLTTNYYLDVMNILERYSDVKPSKSTTNDTNIFNMMNLGCKQSVANDDDNKGKLYKEYLNVVENKIVDKDIERNTYLCEICNKPLLMSQIESLMICSNCGKAEQYFDISIQGMTYEQEINSEVNVSFSYKRINHFNEWLAQFQAKESTEIPKELLDSLTNEFKKSRISNMSQITTKKVKEYLKKLNYNKYYEHTTHITNLLNGIKPPTMTPILEEKLRNMFRQIQIPFDTHKPKDRSNFLSYSYCLYKFCELLGEDEFKQQFPLLKSREKLYQQDCIWKNICMELKWEFIKTI